MALQYSPFIYTGRAPGGDTSDPLYIAPPQFKDTVWDFVRKRAYVFHMTGRTTIDTSHPTNQYVLWSTFSSGPTFIYTKVVLVVFNLDSLVEITRNEIDFGDYFTKRYDSDASETDVAEPYSGVGHADPHYQQKIMTIYANSNTIYWPNYIINPRLHDDTGMISFTVLSAMEISSGAFNVLDWGTNDVSSYGGIGTRARTHHFLVNGDTGAYDVARGSLLYAQPIQMIEGSDGSWSTIPDATASGTPGVVNSVLDSRIYAWEFPVISAYIGIDSDKRVTLTWNANGESYDTSVAPIDPPIRIRAVLVNDDADSLSVQPGTVGDLVVNVELQEYFPNIYSARDPVVACVGKKYQTTEGDGIHEHTDFYLLAPKNEDANGSGDVDKWYVLKLTAEYKPPTVESPLILWTLNKSTIGSFEDGGLFMHPHGMKYYDNKLIINYTTEWTPTPKSVFLQYDVSEDTLNLDDTLTYLGSNTRIMQTALRSGVLFAHGSYLDMPQNVSPRYAILTQYSIDDEQATENKHWKLDLQSFTVDDWWTTAFEEELTDTGEYTFYGLGDGFVPDDINRCFYALYFSEGWIRVSLPQTCFVIKPVSFIANSAEGTQDIVHSDLAGLDIVAAIFVFGMTPEEDDEAEHVNVSQGFTDFTDSFVLAGYSLNALGDSETAAVSDVRQSMYKGYVIRDHFVQNVAELDSVLPNGVRINWLARDAVADYRGFVIFIAGDTVQAKVGFVENPPRDGVEVAVGFRPELIWAASMMGNFDTGYDGAISLSQGWWFKVDNVAQEHHVTAHGGTDVLDMPMTAEGSDPQEEVADADKPFTDYGTEMLLRRQTSYASATTFFGFSITDSDVDSFTATAVNDDTVLLDFGYLALNFSGRARFRKVTWDMSGKANGTFAQFHTDGEMEVMTAVMLLPMGSPNASGTAADMVLGLGVLTENAQMLLMGRSQFDIAAVRSHTWFSEEIFNYYDANPTDGALNIDFESFNANQNGWQYTLTGGPKDNVGFQCLVIGRYDQCYPYTWHQVQLMEPV
jgi:hypothetical protein